MADPTRTVRVPRSNWKRPVDVQAPSRVAARSDSARPGPAETCNSVRSVERSMPQRRQLTEKDMSLGCDATPSSRNSVVKRGYVSSLKTHRARVDADVAGYGNCPCVPAGRARGLVHGHVVPLLQRPGRDQPGDAAAHDRHTALHATPILPLYVPISRSNQYVPPAACPVAQCFIPPQTKRIRCLDQSNRAAVLRGDNGSRSYMAGQRRSTTTAVRSMASLLAGVVDPVDKPGRRRQPEHHRQAAPRRGLRLRRLPRQDGNRPAVPQRRGRRDPGSGLP